MEPTLKKNDRVLVNKLSYDVHSVHRGDIVVFDRPTCKAANTPTWASCATTDQIKDLIKRVIALPGETISVHDNHVFIDGKELREPYTHGLPSQMIPTCGFPGTYQVPKGDVFVMGDNRTDSTDSRCFGPIPENIIVGRAFVRVWPLSRVGLL
jgi:signal peptidase I